jgi:hypothetical protein
MFDWSMVTLLALVVYVYAVEAEYSNWNAILAGAALWPMDWANEIANALVLRFDGHAALWAVAGHSSYVILVGLTIEISLFFAINGVIFAKLLPADPAQRILGLPFRTAGPCRSGSRSSPSASSCPRRRRLPLVLLVVERRDFPGHRRVRLPDLLSRRLQGS